MCLLVLLIWDVWNVKVEEKKIGWAERLALLILDCPWSEMHKKMVGLWFGPNRPGIIWPMCKL
jgi:hypothetical protein